VNLPDEHDDDLQPEVDEGAEIETQNYEEVDLLEETPPESAEEPDEEDEGEFGEANDTI